MKKILSLIIIGLLLLTASGYIGVLKTNLADAIVYPVQLQPFTLSGSGAALSATTLNLSSFKTIDGTDLTMANFGTVGYGTIEPGNKTQEEQISFTGITQNANGTAQLTGVKTVGFLTPFTETSGIGKSHAGGVFFVISNTSGFYNTFANKQNNETITGFWNFPNPVATTSSPVTLNYATSTFMALTGNQTIAGIKTFTSSPIVPEPTAASQVTSKNYVDNVASQGAATATPSRAGISKISVTASDANNPIVIGTNDARIAGGTYGTSTYAGLESTVSTSTTSKVSTTTINVDSTKSTYDVFLRIASTTNYQGVKMYFNGASGYGGGLYSNGTSSQISNCGGGYSSSGMFAHVIINGGTGSTKRGTSQFYCGDGSSGSITTVTTYGIYWNSTSPIFSISFTGVDGNGDLDYGLATTSIIVYQK